MTVFEEKTITSFCVLRVKEVAQAQAVHKVNALSSSLIEFLF